MPSNLKKISVLFILFLGLMLFSACATHSLVSLSDPPGFFSGLLHGFLVVFNFIISLFSDYEMYNFPNSGGWYDFGFLLGASIFFGGSGAGTCKKNK